MDFNNYPILSIYYLISIIWTVTIPIIFKKFGGICGKILVLGYIIVSVSFVGVYSKYNENFYKLYNITKNYNEKELSNGYKNLSKIYHPDRNPDIDNTYFLYLTNLKEILQDMIKNKSLKKIYNYFGDKEDIFDLYFAKSTNQSFLYYFNYYSEKYFMEYIIILFLSFMVLKELELKTKKSKLIWGLSAIFLVIETFLYDYYNYPQYSIYLKNIFEHPIFNQMTYFEISFILKFLTITYVTVFLIYQNLYFVSDYSKIDNIMKNINNNNQKEELIELKSIFSNCKKIINDKRKEFRIIILLIIVLIGSMYYNGKDNN